MTTPSDPDFYDQKYSEGEEIIRPYKLKALNLLGEGSGNLLDVGCGTGQFSCRLRDRGYSPVGIDLSRKALLKYQELNFPCIQLNLNHGELPFCSGTFQTVWFTEVIEHIKNPSILMQEINRVLEQDGKLVLTCPNSYHYFYRLLYAIGKSPSELQHPEHINFFSMSRIFDLITDAGFEVTNSTGRNLFAVLKESWIPESIRPAVWKVLETFGFTREYSFKFDQDLLILTEFSDTLNSMLADDLIFRAQKSTSSEQTND